MPIIERPPLVVPKKTVTVRIEESLLLRLAKYQTFIGGSRDHVINGMLRWLFEKDRDFKNWLAAGARESQEDSSQRRDGRSKKNEPYIVQDESPLLHNSHNDIRKH